MATFRNRTGNREEIFLEGKDPYSGTLGLPPRAGINPLDKFAADMQVHNPIYQAFQDESRTFPEIAPLSQQKIDRAASTVMPNFRDDVDNVSALNFLDRYQQGVQKGLISKEDSVGPDKIAYIANQPAMMGSNDSNPSTAGKFPGASGVKV